MSARLSYGARVETALAPLVQAKEMRERGEIDDATLAFMNRLTCRELEEIASDAELNLVPEPGGTA